MSGLGTLIRVAGATRVINIPDEARFVFIFAQGAGGGGGGGASNDTFGTTGGGGGASGATCAVWIPVAVLGSQQLVCVPGQGGLGGIGGASNNAGGAGSAGGASLVAFQSAFISETTPDLVALALGGGGGAGGTSTSNSGGTAASIAGFPAVHAETKGEIHRRPGHAGAGTGSVGVTGGTTTIASSNVLAWGAPAGGGTSTNLIDSNGGTFIQNLINMDLIGNGGRGFFIERFRMSIPGGGGGGRHATVGVPGQDGGFGGSGGGGGGSSRTTGGDGGRGGDGYIEVMFY